jgi:hypothetical protein
MGGNHASAAQRRVIMKPTWGLTEAIHGNEEEKGRQEKGREEKVDEEARSGSFARHPPAAIACRRCAACIRAGSTAS